MIISSQNARTLLGAVVCAALTGSLSASAGAQATSSPPANPKLQAPTFAPTYALYCQGPLSSIVLADHNQGLKFTWAKHAASVKPPLQGQCAWADRAARGHELTVSVLESDNACNLATGTGPYTTFAANTGSSSVYVYTLGASATPPFSSSDAPPGGPNCPPSVAH